ncbi:RHS repeat domain-containing protein, partial [Microcoleus sp. herbarium12]|uniref:RHS repeat domain-containing protein n=1 Tax=Microcoleus sp. herbarium12 TaxID=3055437 RepID=UPI002FD18AAD
FLALLAEHPCSKTVRSIADGTFNYVYDDEGNLIRKTEIATNKVTEYQWDYRNRLAGVFDKNAAGDVTQQVGFKYDSQNRRISKKVGNAETRFVYDRDNVLFDFVGSGANQPVLDKRYLFGTGVDQILAQESAGGSVLWALTDQLGTVKDWVNNSGSVANHVVYGSFGQVVSQSNAAFGSRYGFTGREFDAETGLSYYRSRYYSAGMGRFIGEDSVGFDGGDANLYRYVKNSPLNSTDPFGFYGKLIEPQKRKIRYNVGTETKTANEIKDVKKDVDKNPSNVSIESDNTIAVIEYSGSRTGGETNRKNRPSVLGILTDDHQGHIVSGELGGKGSLNNVFAQNGWINSDYNSPWFQFESSVNKALTDFNGNKCLTEPTLLFYQVSLEYKQPNAPRIRPTSLSASATFFPSEANVTIRNVPNPAQSLPRTHRLNIPAEKRGL